VIDPSGIDVMRAPHSVNRVWLFYRFWFDQYGPLYEWRQPSTPTARGSKGGVATATLGRFVTGSRESGATREGGDLWGRDCRAGCSEPALDAWHAGRAAGTLS